MAIAERWEEFAKEQEEKAAKLEKFGMVDKAKVLRQNAERAREAAKRCKGFNKQ